MICLFHCGTFALVAQKQWWPKLLALEANLGSGHCILDLHTTRVYRNLVTLKNVLDKGLKL